MNSKIIAVDFDGTLCENKWPEIGEANEDMIYYLRKRQAEGDKLILWRYESATNSIVIQMDKRDRHQRHGLVRKVMFDDFHRIRSNQFEFVMVRFLNEMAQELEYRIKVAPEPMKGEDND